MTVWRGPVKRKHPKAYTRPWTITLQAELMADTELLEDVCNENNKSTGQHFVVSDDDRRKAQSALRSKAIRNSCASASPMVPGS